MKLYKFLNPDGSTLHGYGQWHLPTKSNEPGKWMPYLKGRLISCEYGYHVLRPDDLAYWIGAELWEVECKGKIVESTNKVVVRHARLIRQIDKWDYVKFAEECARHVQHLTKHNHATARAAALAARSAARSAAYAADTAAYAADTAARSARSAAYTARSAYADDDDAYADEKKWQNDLIKGFL